MRRLAVAQQDPTPAPNGHGPPDGAAAMEAERVALEAKLRRQDAELKAAETARDTANLALGGHPDEWEAWRLEEQREHAEKAITRLLEERRPLADRHARLLRYLTPYQQRQREITELEASIEVCERLDSVWAHLDAAIAAINAARPAVARSGGARAIPSSLEELCRLWGPDSYRRFRVQATIGADALRFMREHLARVKAGLA